jgi:hypothetical protein
MLVASPLAAAEGKRYAVLVGVKQYEHAKLEPLEFTENDVTELADLLKPAGYEVVLLTDSTGQKDEKLAPTKANIEKHLGGVLDRCKRDDLVLVAFAGHGLQFDGKPEAFFCPKDAKPLPERTETLISLEGIYKQLDDSGAGVKLLLVDACRNEPGGRGRGVDAGSLGNPPPKGVYAFFSCSAGERAFEHKNLKHGVFFHYVLEGLKGEAKDKNDEVSFEALALYVRNEVPRRVPELFQGAKQTPSLRVRDASGRSPVVLTQTESIEAEMRKVIAEVERLIATGKGSAGYIKQIGPMGYHRWRSAAERGSLSAFFLVGRCFSEGAGVERDEGEAVTWYRKAADQGNAIAQNALGVCYLKGWGVAKDEAEAVKWFRKASDQQIASAQYYLGLSYENGWSVAKDEAEAVKWFRKAADREQAQAQCDLGFRYLKGRGVTKDEAEAVQWFRKAADQGDATAQNNLGTCYLEGTGVAKDEAEAVKWYRKAAAQGYQPAQGTLKLLGQAP